MTKLEQFFKDQTNVLAAQATSVANVEHRGSIGSNRETFIKEFIEKSFPKKFVVGTGEIFDSEGRVSKQCDVVVCDELLPVFDYSSTQQFVAEGVFSHIEVKSNLTSDELTKSLEVTKSVKKINKKVDAVMHTGDLPDKVFSCIFAYKGVSKEKAREKLTEYYISESKIAKKIDAICVLNEYIILKQVNPSTQQLELIGFETKDSTLALFFVTLYNSMYKNWMGQPNLAKYITNTNFTTF